MKKAAFFFALLLSLALTGTAQTAAPADFYAGKWEILITGSPRGDVKFHTNLVRKDGKLTGELVDVTGGPNSTEKRAITKVEEADDRLAIYFESSQGGEISMDLAKVDADHLKGSLMSFETTATRLK